MYYSFGNHSYHISIHLNIVKEVTNYLYSEDSISENIEFIESFDKLVKKILEI